MAHRQIATAAAGPHEDEDEDDDWDNVIHLPVASSSSSFTPRRAWAGIRLQAVRQRGSWDCGLAAAAIALDALSRYHVAAAPNQIDPRLRGVDRVDMDDVEAWWDELAAQNGFPPRNRSVWTIELFAMMRMVASTKLHIDTHTIDSTMRMTTTSTFDEQLFTAYDGIGFYSGPNTASDMVRVSKYVREATASAWPLRSGHHVAMSEIVAKLTGGTSIFIALVDASLLVCPCVSRAISIAVQAAIVASGCCCCSDQDDADAVIPLPFAGHFIVLCGVDVGGDTRRLVYRNPAKRNGGYCTVTVHDLDRARRRRGTDEDLIEIRLGTLR